MHPLGLPRGPRALLRRRRRRHRPRHPGVAGRGGPALLAAGAGLDGDRARSTAGRPTPPSAPCARPATTPRRTGRWASACSTTWPSPPPPWPSGASGCSIVDWDAHHGNGTQDRLLRRPPRALRLDAPVRASTRAPGALDETGGRAAPRGPRVNFPFPAGTTGDVYLAGARRGGRPGGGGVRARRGCSCRPASTPTGPTRSPAWACRPATTPTSPAPGARRWLRSPAGWSLFLEGGYDLEALRSSAGACVAALVGARLPARSRPPRAGPARRSSKRLVAAPASQARS